MRLFFKNLFKGFVNNIGIDLGTSNISVYLEGQGIIIREPSYISINIKTNKIVALGEESKKMLGRSPEHIKVFKPIEAGTISDYDIMEEYLIYIFEKINSINKKVVKSRVVFSVPVGISNVEIKSIKDALYIAGASEVILIDSPVLAGIGMGLPIEDPSAFMIIDLGGGGVNVAIISLLGNVSKKNLKISGEKIDNDIINFLKKEYSILIGSKTAEEIKIEIGSVLPNKNEKKILSVKGRDILSGLPKEIQLNEDDIREIIQINIVQVVDEIKKILENTPPEVLGDILKNGILLSGGMSSIDGLVEFFESELKVKIYLSPNPLTDVIIGCSYILKDLEKYKEIIIKDEICNTL